MQEWNELILDQLMWIVGGLVILIVWLLLWNFIQGSRLRKMRKKYEMMMQGTGIENLESLLIDLKVEQNKIEDIQEEQKNRLEQLHKLLPKLKAKTGIKRYNAYAEHGNELSFSLSLVDDEKNGVVITSIYNREGSFIYAKPLVKGESSYPLSPEEREVISLAGLSE